MNFIQAQLTPNNVGIELFGSKECLNIEDEIYNQLEVGIIKW